MLKKVVLGMSAAALTLSPVVAQAAPASAPISGESDMASEARFGPALVIIALAAAGMLALILTDDDEDSISA
ncbi:MAG: hypothetical protein DI636_00250 [Pelagerythrobacter marensis]|uniref:hypothetical protein n=1 Tax=Qipengyuania sp. YIM B01966 TaxID=2778646 RepID=UPI000DB535B4|nr:hypothetical protein [Qipengyuania sp. YIM B01966]PZO72667.1 MAG: hypothetical protein DI636_00250 [Pelagerythrobacter marensis]PZU17339.1 MAG: hypothetical protein DI591_03025 [Citromicrobium sp.]